MNKQIFKGVRVLDFSQVIAGSYGTTILGDLGAEVVKIEPPGQGDTLRLAGPMYHGESGFFLLNNRNKKSISIDLNNPEGVALVKRLIPHYDVIAQNFKPGVLDRLGLGYATIRELKPDAIYVTVSGYGYHNSWSMRPAYDNIIQCESGLASQNGMPGDGRPLRCPLSAADYTGAMYAAMGVMAALYHRAKTGEGQHVDVAMYDALISLMDNSFLTYDVIRDEYLASDDARKEELLAQWGLRSSGNRHPGAAPHGFYRTKDGWVAHMSLTNKMWYDLLTIVGRADLKGDPAYDQVADRKVRWREVDAIIEAWTSQHTTEEVIKTFEAHRLPCGRMKTIPEAYDDPHSVEREIFAEVEHPVAGKRRITNIPIKFSLTPATVRTPSPMLGQHTYEVLGQDLGMQKHEIDALLERKVLHMGKQA